MGESVVLQIKCLQGVQTQAGSVDLILEVEARPSTAITQGASTLNHEILDDAVKNQAIIKWAGDLLAGFAVGERLAAFCQIDEMSNGFRRSLRPKLKLDFAMRCLNQNLRFVLW